MSIDYCLFYIIIKIRDKLIFILDVQWKMKGIVGQPLGQSLTVDCAANGIAHPSYIKILDESGQEIKTNGWFIWKQLALLIL